MTFLQHLVDCDEGFEGLYFISENRLPKIEPPEDQLLDSSSMNSLQDVRQLPQIKPRNPNRGPVALPGSVQEEKTNTFMPAQKAAEDL
jgi:hypothetical protein